MRYAVLAIAVLSVGAMAACSSSHSAPAPASSSPQAATAVTSSAPAAQPSTSLTSSPMDTWCLDLSHGYSNMETVNQDLNNVRTDYGNSQYGSVENDGTKLVEDAAAGQLDPPPGTAHQRKDYVAYMKVAGLMGGDFAQGDFNLGFDEASQAASYHSVMQGIADQCAVAWGGSPAA